MASRDFDREGRDDHRSVVVPAETINQKAFRILTESRLTIERVDADGGWVVAHCRGDTGDYALGWDPKVKAWRCTCANVKGECSHISALIMLVVRP